MTTRAHIRPEDLAEFLYATAGPYIDVPDDVTLRGWLALNSTDPATAQATLAEIADLHGTEAAQAIVTSLTQALDAAGPDGIPA